MSASRREAVLYAGIPILIAVLTLFQFHDAAPFLVRDAIAQVREIAPLLEYCAQQSLSSPCIRYEFNAMQHFHQRNSPSQLVLLGRDGSTRYYFSAWDPYRAESDRPPARPLLETDAIHEAAAAKKPIILREPGIWGKMGFYEAAYPLLCKGEVVGMFEFVMARDLQ